jgi:Spy/CpxP family protein refolding chaperone
VVFRDKHLALVMIIASVLLAVSPLNAQPTAPGTPQPSPNDADPPAAQGNILNEHLVLFVPELVLPNTEQLNLNDNQVQTIEADVDATKEQLSQAQEMLKTETNNLDQLLKAEPGDEAAILAQLDKVLQIEQQIKVLHFSMLVRIRSQLTADQRGSLEDIRDGMIAERQQLQQRLQGKFIQIQKYVQQYAQKPEGQQTAQAIVQRLQSAQQKLQQGDLAGGEAILDQTLQQLQAAAPAAPAAPAANQ